MSSWSDIRDDLVATFGEGTRALGYYMPVFRFVEDAFLASSTRPLVVGVSGPQGSGKSTLVEHAVRALESLGRSTVALSIDDFYLTRREQLALAARHPQNPYLEHRGYPGTHDVGLGEATLRALRASASGSVRVVGYDKGAFDGRGDRAAPETWRTIATPLDIILLEGWMLGFEAVPEQAITDRRLCAPNAALEAYVAWTSQLGAFVHLDTDDLDAIVGWRIDAERARREQTGVGLSDEEARDYIERFLPAYRLWAPGLRGRSPSLGPLLRVRLGPDRLPVSPPARA